MECHTAELQLDLGSEELPPDDSEQEIMCQCFLSAAINEFSSILPRSEQQIAFRPFMS